MKTMNLEQIGMYVDNLELGYTLETIESFGGRTTCLIMDENTMVAKVELKDGFVSMAVMTVVDDLVQEYHMGGWAE